MAETNEGFFISELFPFSNSLIAKARKILEPIIHTELSDEDYNEILNTLVGLELLLREIADEG